ncbi:ComF family protein [Lamprobacter modestohalophilus]|uniref:ComF family protein n=1 Tax=Lamprobacter modestohalophilus TaxID=1064514 RepID=UPI002ADEC7AC|nr:ComF family protein [Lamprobacter modestohalophilus]MEA1051796.1 ComF family protein [Lamprobacter modestohalophilus]
MRLASNRCVGQARQTTAWQRFAEQALTLLYPPTCVLCGAPGVAGRDLCAGCHADLPLLGPHCTRCAQPFSGREHQSGESGSEAAGICGRCQRQPPPYERCTAAFRYEDPLPTLVGGIKFQSKLNLIRLLGDLLADALTAARADESQHPGWETPDAILPVPLHPRRLRIRGYNQALELARLVSRRLDIPINHRCCQRTRSTQAQSELNEERRFSNIRGAFEVTSTRPLPRRIAILDDVVTTGATVSELARVLKQAGCERIDIWALARTP